MKLRFLLFTLALLISVASAHAQSTNSISVDIVPPNPQPRENTEITLSSYNYNLDSVLISWSVNGKNISSGVGKKTLLVTAGAAGEEVNIVATISLPDGAINTRIVLRSSATILLWQANDSYVPPFYRGKALPTADSEIKVVAMPEIRTSKTSGLVDPKNMTYTWKKDYANDVIGSGYGKNYFLFINDYLENSNNVSVTASTLDQKFSGEASITIGTSQPKILFYKNDSELGTLWGQALGDHTIEGAQLLEATPYFISPKELTHPALIWRWLINDATINLTDFRKNILPLQAEAGKHGTSRVRLEIENKYKLFQSINREIKIQF